MSRYSKAQLHAISRSYSDKKKREIAKKAIDLRIATIFEYQNLYKTLTGFVNAYGSIRFKQACKTAKIRLEEIRQDYLSLDRDGYREYLGFGYTVTEFIKVKVTLQRIDEILK